MAWQLNKEWREVDAPTDVLSFPQMDEDDDYEDDSDDQSADDDPDAGPAYLMPGGHALLGDVVISIPTAQRQAAARGHSLETEVHVLLVHGMLHLLGYDHEGEGAEAQAQAAAMRAEEARVLAEMGWAGAGLISAAEAEADAAEEAEEATRKGGR
jgi:probable rRNA maturation factor